ncbi:cyclic nucleotide-binding domain-containing protein [Mycobacterium malmoense]|uniref:GNAT family N-acetyltransferase n=1 Tax=Mycobacterium malmoense TaxID=1780 RepID=A0ABX3SPE6_MYCMA|nr:cyclic nucleotide-binding domain-containing protein [Mycobacterium malmoense]ORA79989.1 GNAT family N-acetyltransferase [Mycobacterium malmoense]QZA19991.1 cyclic nucleotide-binding domain-containing protein [Mycobacterium malmoense]UNB96741.1 cyclic nucleotide-binding domain-containing protein [Mycobacterium malmoense]
MARNCRDARCANRSPSELAALDVFADVPARDLAELAAGLRPLHAAAGEVLMRQGEQAVSFAIIVSGRVEVSHLGPDGQVAVTELPAGTIVGEIALLRSAPRTATVIAKDEVRGYLGYDGAFERMLAMPAVADRMVRTARQRLAAYVAPIPVSAGDRAGLLLRPVLPGDAERFKGNGSFSRETLYRRYQGGAPTDARLAYLFEVDYVDHFVWVVADGPHGPVVGDARFIRDKDDPASAEVALTVADAYQGHGLGTLLLGALAVAARVDGVKRFHARVLSDNPPARALGDRVNARWECAEPGVVTTTGEIPEFVDLSLDPGTRLRIQRVAHQVIHAFG